ncbi:inhibin alpha chain isoform X1 [Echeneis naucrates]|nr:inhibin alpha chain isoform X1 [Echeneis naucrates]
MASCAALILGLFWFDSLVQPCRGEELYRERILEELPVATTQSPDVAKGRRMHRQIPRTSRTAWVKHQSDPDQGISQIILFPNSDSSCARFDSATGETSERHFMYYFQPSARKQRTLVTSAHFWFFGGEAAPLNSSAQLFILTPARQLVRAAQAPSKMSSDGWITFSLDRRLLASVAEGPFLLQVRCPICRCQNEPDKTPFLHIHAQPRLPVRSPRHAPASIPWSPSALDLLQRPSQDRPQHGDCRREAVEISFEELGWDNWIVHPKVLTFYYCRGNCSATDRTSTALGLTQCCAPVPGTMKSLRVTTTSDGGHSFKYETLPNIIPGACACI